MIRCFLQFQLTRPVILLKKHVLKKPVPALVPRCAAASIRGSSSCAGNGSSHVTATRGYVTRSTENTTWRASFSGHLIINIRAHNFKRYSCVHASQRFQAFRAGNTSCPDIQTCNILNLLLDCGWENIRKLQDMTSFKNRERCEVVW